MTARPRTKKFNYTRLRLLSRPVIALPLIVFTVFVIVSIIGFVSAQSSLDSTRDRVIDRRVQENALKLRSSLQAYTLIASGGAGFAETSDIDAGTWDSFISAYNIPSNFPAINAVTYAQVMNHDDAQVYVDERNAAVGSNMFSLTASNPDFYIMTRYTNPNSPAFASRLGIDEYAIPSRKQAIDSAIAMNQPVITSEPQLIVSANDAKAKPQLGFIIFAPIYDKSQPLDTTQERRAALLGTSNVSFQTSKFFDTIYSETDKISHTYLTIYQGADEHAPVVYQGGVRPSSRDSIPFTQHVHYANQTFTYVYQFSDSDLLTFVELRRPLSTLIAGIALGGLLAIIMLFSIRARLHKISFEKEREVQLAKDELLSLASHQLRTPATGVKQYMGMVLQGFAGEITAQQKDFLQKAYDSNDRQLHIINDILHLAKLDAGRIVLSKTTFDMSELVQSVLEEQTQAAREAEVAITPKMPRHLQVYADSHMMRMVVENLISNGIKYTNPEGKVNVTLKNNRDAYELVVKDTGVGIADADFDKLFKQFSRVANERSHLVSGTGVGLYLVKNLVELHGGKVRVKSKLGQGTTFTVSFPHEIPEV